MLHLTEQHWDPGQDKPSGSRPPADTYSVSRLRHTGQTHVTPSHSPSPQALAPGDRQLLRKAGCPHSQAPGHCPLLTHHLPPGEAPAKVLGARSAGLAAHSLGLPEDALHGRDPVRVLDVEDLELWAGRRVTETPGARPRASGTTQDNLCSLATEPSCLWVS